MTGFNSYAAGPKVYNGGSFAAHRGGGLDPIGYIERELNNAAGTGGSDQRSGFAAAALARQQGVGGKDKRRKGKKGKKGKGKHTLPGTVSGNDDNNGVPEIEDDNLQAVSTPVISNATGQLALDPAAMQELTDAELAFNNNNAQLDNAQALAAQQFASGQRDLGIQQQQDQRRDLNRFSARGMAFSSGYGQEVTNSAGMFGNAFSDLSGSYNNTLGDIGNQRNANHNFLGSARSRHAARQAEINAQLAAQQSLGMDPGYQDPGPAPEEPPSAPASFAPAARERVVRGPSPAAKRRSRRRRGRR